MGSGVFFVFILEMSEIKKYATSFMELRGLRGGFMEGV